MSNTIRNKMGRRAALLSGAALVGASALSSTANATLTINLRFTDGSTAASVASGFTGDVPVQVWATVTGANALSASNFDGLGFVTYSLTSSLPGGAGTGLAGGLAAPALNATWAASGSQLGALVDLNGDGITDLGSSTTNSNTSFAKGRNAGAVWSDDATATKNTLANGVEFLLETVNYHINSAASGNATNINPIIPPWVTGLTKGANWWQDNATKTSSSGTSNGAYSGGTAVALTVTGGGGPTQIISLTSAAPSVFGAKLTNAAVGSTAGDKATFNPNAPVADSINVVGSGALGYVAGFANGINNTAGKATDYVQVSGFSPATDPEIYALNIKVGGVDPTGPQLATIIADINLAAGHTGSIVASTVTAPYSTLFPGYDILLTGANNTASQFLGFDFTKETNVAGVVVTDVAAVPEPASIAAGLLGASGLLLSRRRARKA